MNIQCVLCQVERNSVSSDNSQKSLQKAMRIQTILKHEIAVTYANISLCVIIDPSPSRTDCARKLCFSAMYKTIFCNLTKKNISIQTFSRDGEDCCTLQIAKKSWVYRALTDSASPLSNWSAKDVKFALQAFAARVTSQLGSQPESTRSQSDAIGLQPDTIEDEATHAGPKRLRLDPMVKFDGEESPRLGNFVFSKPRQGCDQTTTLLPISCFQTIWINNFPLQVVGGNKEGPVQLIASVTNINSMFSILEDTFKDWVREGREASNKCKARIYDSVYWRAQASCWVIHYIDADGDKHYERFYCFSPHPGKHNFLLAKAVALQTARKAWNRLDCSSKPRLPVCGSLEAW